MFGLRLFSQAVINNLLKPQQQFEYLSDWGAQMPILKVIQALHIPKNNESI